MTRTRRFPAVSGSFLEAEMTLVLLPVRAGVWYTWLYCGYASGGGGGGFQGGRGGA